MRNLIAIVFVLAIVGCAKVGPDNRAERFATWMDPAAQCVPLYTGASNGSASGGDTALCAINGTRHFCTAPSGAAPSCAPYQKTEKAPAPAPTAEAPAPAPSPAVPAKPSK